MTSRARFQKHSATSHAGARHADRTLGLRQRAVLNVIIAHGGATIAEIKRELGIDASSVSGRISEIRDDFGLIADSGERRASVSPVAGTVWTLTPKGREFAKTLQLPALEIKNQLSLALSNG